MRFSKGGNESRVGVRGFQSAAVKSLTSTHQTRNPDFEGIHDLLNDRMVGNWLRSLF